MALFSWYKETVINSHKPKSTRGSLPLNQSMWPTAQVRDSLKLADKSKDLALSNETNAPNNAVKSGFEIIKQS